MDESQRHKFGIDGVILLIIIIVNVLEGVVTLIYGHCVKYVLWPELQVLTSETQQALLSNIHFTKHVKETTANKARTI